MVRLITHNMLACHVRTSSFYSTACSPLVLIPIIGNCTSNNFPLVFSDVELVVREAPENLDFLRRFLPKLDWPALVSTARSVSASRWTPAKRGRAEH